MKALDTDERLNELEIKFMEQAETLDSFSQTVYKQQLKIDELEREMKLLTLRLQSLSTSNLRSESEEVPPPHY